MSESDIDFEQLLEEQGSLWRRGAGRASSSQNVVHPLRDCQYISDNPPNLREIEHVGELPLRPTLCSACEKQLDVPKKKRGEA